MNAINLLKKWLLMLIFASVSVVSRGEGGNYVRRRIFTDSAGTMYRSETSYYDGLGRNVQTVLSGAQPGLGIVSGHTEYDAAGRPLREWLPSPLPSAQPDTIVPLPTLIQHYGSLYGGDPRPFSETGYDGSPLGRVRSAQGPGQAWAAAGKMVTRRYLTTDPGKDTLRCRIFSAVPSPSDTSLTLSRGGWYPAGSLTVEETVDEDGARAYVFTDLFGRKVLERRLDASANYSFRFLDTYYVYDNGDRLLAVLPPMLSSAKVSGNMAAQWSSLTDGDLRKYAYLYLYDARGRLRAKRLPGCGWTEYGYDLGDEMVWSRDPVQRERGEYLFVLRDGRGRECVRGICDTLEIVSGSYARARRSYPAMSPADTALIGYRADGIVLTGAKVLAINYYDDYSFMGAAPVDSLICPLGEDGAYVADTECTERYDKSAEGLLTGTLRRVLDLPAGGIAMTQNAGISGPFLWTVNYYDENGRPVQVRESAHRGTLETESVQYDFTGNPLLRKLFHDQTDLEATVPRTERYAYTYDGLGRLAETWHQWGDGTQKKLSEQHYDAVGRLVGESRSDDAPSLETEYAYGVRGVMTAKDVGSRTGTLDGGGVTFSERLCYHTGTPGFSVTPRWGGNISGVLWRTGLADSLRRYCFGYDGLSRLKTAGYSGLEGQYTRQTEYTYDRNGNITKLIRNERNAADSLIARENLTFTYNGNRIVEVVEGSAVTPSEANPPSNPVVGPIVPEPLPDPFFPGVVNPVYEDPTPTVLSYYPDGSLKYDDYNEIMNISYNAIGLPSSVERGVRILPSGMSVSPSASNWGTVSYGYSADGERLRRSEEPWDPMAAPSAQEDEVVDYIGNCIYRNDVLKTVLIDGGYIDATDGSYHFYVTDHLGSVRAVTDASGVIEKTFDFYPFGSSYERVASANPGQEFRYSGKQVEDKFGCREVYDFSARWYSPVYGRFQTMDPLCEKYYSLSPYAYCANSPINVVDPSGEDAVVIVFPDYKVTVGPIKLPLGHAGVLLIDNKTGVTKYYEYGRYDKENRGIVRHKTIPNVTIAENGRPATESLNVVLRAISNKAGHGGRIEGAYIESNEFEKMNRYARERESENNNPQVEYSLFDNNCATFAVEVVKQDEDVDIADEEISFRPKRMIEQLQKEYEVVKFP